MYDNLWNITSEGLQGIGEELQPVIRAIILEICSKGLGQDLVNKAMSYSKTYQDLTDEEQLLCINVLEQLNYGI